MIPRNLLPGNSQTWEKVAAKFFLLVVSTTLKKRKKERSTANFGGHLSVVQNLHKTTMKISQYEPVGGSDGQGTSQVLPIFGN